MNKNNLKKFLEAIQESLNVSEEPVHNSNSQKAPVEEVQAKEDTSDTQVITQLAVDFAYFLNERDFENLDSRAEYNLYTVDHLVDLIKNGDEQNTVNLFKEYKIKSQYVDCEFLSITFSEDRMKAEVVYNVTTCVFHAKDSYFRNLNKTRDKSGSVSVGTPFATEYTLQIKKEKGTWKIDKFKTS